MERQTISNYIKVNQLRYDSFSQKYQGTSSQVLIYFDGIFLNVMKHEWLSPKVDDASSISRGLMVKLYKSN